MTRLLLPVLLTLSVATSVLAGNSPNWRGPNGNGVSPEKDVPVKWNKGSNIAWRNELPGRAGSTPAVWGDRVFVTCPGDGQNQALCFNLKSGTKEWQVAVHPERGAGQKKVSSANPSSVTDGDYVFVYYRSGDFACITTDGRLLWQHNLQDRYGEDTLWWDLGTSPILTQNHVVIACMHSGPSYLAAFEKDTGNLAWKHERNLGAPVEAAHSYTTPVVVTDGDTETIVVVGADHVTAHNANTGEEIWRVHGLNPTGNEYFRSISSPVVYQDLVIAPYSRGNSLTAIRLGGSGDVTKSHIVWHQSGVGADVPSPVGIDNRIYICRDNGEILCLDAGSGEQVWGQRVEKNRGRFWSSPVIADGHLYATRSDGTTFVLKTGDEFKLVSKNSLGEETVATPVFANGKLLIQTSESLFCIGE